MNAYPEEDNQVDALEPIAPRIRHILRQYKEKRQLSTMANRLGFHPARLTEMITKTGDGRYKRKITFYYLAKFIDAGLMDVDQILDGRNLEDLPDRARRFFKRRMLSHETTELVVGAQRRGINVNRILKEILYPEGCKSLRA
jgi:hypothetical protein